MNDPELKDAESGRDRRLLALTWLLVLCTGLCFVLIAARVAQGEIVSDRIVWLALEPWRSPLLDQGMHLISLMGSGIGLALFSLLVIWWHWRVRPDPRLIKRYLLANLGGAIVAWLPKAILARPRPIARASFDAVGYSFPSGHAMAAIIFAGFFAWMVLRRERGPLRWLSAALVLLLAAGSGFSRVYLGAHYFTDVLAGYCYGLFWLGITMLSPWPPKTPIAQEVDQEVDQEVVPVPLGQADEHA